MVVVDGCLFHLTSVSAGALSTYLHHALTLMYASDRLHLDLLNDNKHYQQTVEENRLALLPHKKQRIASYIYYICLFIAINIVFLLLLFNRGRMSPLKRIVKRILPL